MKASETPVGLGIASPLCTLTRASRRLPKKRNRRAACPLPQAGEGIFQKEAVALSFNQRGRDLHKGVKDSTFSDDAFGAELL
jgi:hypothetical protein